MLHVDFLKANTHVTGLENHAETHSIGKCGRAVN